MPLQVPLTSSFSTPVGVLLRGLVDESAWITAGCGEELPVFFAGSTSLQSREPGTTAIRIDAKDRMRLGGLVWPEARERIAGSAYLTVEPKGAGQVILFAAQPSFRGYFPSSARLFANALIYGPGAGASQPIGW